MKILLTSISSLLISGTAVGVVPALSPNQTNQFESVSFYWNDQHTEEIKSVTSEVGDTPWIMHPVVERTIYTFELGAKKPTFTTLSYINSQGLKAIWGNRSWTWEAPELALKFEHENYIKLADDDQENFDAFATTKIYEHKDNVGMQAANFLTQVGNVWYNEDDVYYMQFLLYQYVNAGPSMVDAVNYVSLGDKLALKM